MQAADVGCDGCHDAAGFQARDLPEGCRIGAHLAGIVQDRPDLLFQAMDSSIPKLIVLKSAVQQGGGVAVEQVMAVQGDADGEAVGELLPGL
jgi:hypothetical protein